MARYIDADKLTLDVQRYLIPNDDGMTTIENAERFFIKLIRQHPTADVVEVVRCKHCNHCERVIDQFNNDWYFCKKTVNNAEVTADHYCGYGERRTDDDLL